MKEEEQSKLFCVQKKIQFVYVNLNECMGNDLRIFLLETLVFRFKSFIKRKHA